ncbi:ATP-binding protein [Oscillibacter sp.]|uniref:sensor histidine kinase n=1 Tax=Oscillibacter sp. TaxID=1945593 RepID=UPI0028B2503E|nr:ATP-binding protein [Oscillibacter sp.]
MKKCVEKVRSSLTMRIGLITALILFAACGITYLFIAWATPITYQSIASDALNEKVYELVNQLESTTLEESGPLFDKFLIDTGADVTVMDGSGKKIALPTSVVMEGTAIDSAVSEDTVWTGITITTTADERVASNVSSVAEEFKPSLWGGLATGNVAVSNSEWDIPFAFYNHPEAYQILVTANIAAVNQTVEAMGRVLPWLTVVILIISFLGALFYSRYITKPIVRLSGISQKMAALDFSWECQEKRRDEIGILGQNLNELSRRLFSALMELKTANASLQEDIDRERELERQRTAFFSAASHELKTPITVLQGQLSGMLAGVDIYQDRDKYLARSLAVTGRMESLVQEMLTISRMEKMGSAMKQEPVLFSGLLKAQIELAEDLAMQKKQTIQADIAPCITIIGDETLLGRAALNLLTNAMNYSPDGSVISVCLEAQDGGVQLVVENSHAHIPEESLPHLFEAFYRVEASRSRETGGSGLGLYLVAMILNRHHAAYEITNTDTGVKARVLFCQ